MPDNKHLRLRAHVPGGSGRKPKTAEKGRTCTAMGCTTILSVYNVKDFCWYHAPIKIPRLRGRK